MAARQKPDIDAYLHNELASYSQWRGLSESEPKRKQRSLNRALSRWE